MDANSVPNPIGAGIASVTTIGTLVLDLGYLQHSISRLESMLMPLQRGSPRELRENSVWL